MSLRENSKLGYWCVCIFMCAMAAGGWGCSSATTGDLSKWMGKPKAEPTDERPEGKPKFEVEGTPLGESDEQTISVAQLSSRVAELLAAERRALAGRWVERFPEASLELLRAADEKTASDGVLAFIAQFHDRSTLVEASGGDWQSFVATERRSRRLEFGQVRARFQKLLTEGHIDIALGQKLVQTATATGSPLAEIDAYRQIGIAELLKERPQEAAQAFTAALERATPRSPYQAAYLLLHLSDAQRRLGDGPAAVQSWRNAVAAAERSLLAKYPVRDPILWERIAYLRPIEEKWSPNTEQVLNRTSPIPLFDGESTYGGEALLWNAVGMWYLDRSQAQTAIVAFKRAESAVDHDHAKQHLRVKQARALSHLDQSGPATAILGGIAADKTSPINPQAIALLGSLRLRAGQADQGLALLRRSVETKETADWDGRAEAEADLGLAFLMSGDEKRGMEWLHRAQKNFERTGDVESLVLALENEAAYFEQSKKSREAKAVTARLRELM